MKSRYRPKYADVAVGRTSVESVPVVQLQRDPMGFYGGFGPLEDFFRPVHPKVRGDFSVGDEFVLASVPKVVVRFAVLELRFRIFRNPGVGGVRREARERPGGSPFERVVRFFLMEAEVLGEFASDEIFFQKRLFVFNRCRRTVCGENDLFRGKVAVAEMRGETRGRSGIRIVAAFGISKQTDVYEVCQKPPGFGLPSEKSQYRRKRTVALRGRELFRNGFRSGTRVCHGQIGQFRAGYAFGYDELLPEFRTQRPGSDFVFVGHRPCGNGTTGIDFENGDSGGFADRLTQCELGTDGRKIEYGRRKSAIRNVSANPFRRVVSEEREKRNPELSQSGGHVRKRIRFRRKVAGIAVRPRRIRDREHDERYVPVITEFGGEEQSAVPGNAHFPIAHVNDRPFPIWGRRWELPDASGVRNERTAYR